MRLGIVGFGGRVGGLVDGPFREAEPDLRVVGIVDPDEKGVRQRLSGPDREAVFYQTLEDAFEKSNCRVLSGLPDNRGAFPAESHARF